MRDTLIERTVTLQRRMADEGIDAILLTDPDSVYYVSGFWGYLGVEFGRPTLLFLPRAGAPSIITPLMESAMARAMTWVEDIRVWEDGVGGEWAEPLRDLLAGSGQAAVGVERLRMPALVAEGLRAGFWGKCGWSSRPRRSR
jgi:Xaa-Pro aminopeptidase